MKLYVGTSGYSYKEWKGIFYPEDVPAKEMLAYYSRQLPAVEINNTFYRLPQASMIENWKSQVPPEFRFSIKATQRITHIKRLKNADEETKYLLETAGLLEERLGVVLFQLPPNSKKDAERLRDFLARLPASTPAAFEFRHESWFDQEVFDLLRAKNCALVASDTDDKPLTEIDQHGGLGLPAPASSNYEDADLAEWMRRVQDQKWKECLRLF